MSNFTCPADLISVIREEEQNASNKIYRDIHDLEKNHMVLSKVKQGRDIYPHENVDRVEVRASMPAPIAFDEYDLSQKGYKDVTLKGRSDCSNKGGLYVGKANIVDDLACDDECTVNINIGYKEDNHFDYGKAIGSPVECTKKLWHLPINEVKQFWDIYLKKFAQYVSWNRELNFLKYFIRFGGANTTAVDGIIGSSNLFYEGKFLAEPTKGLSVAHLLSYRDRMIASGGLGFGEPLVVPAPKRDIIAAIKFHVEQSNPNAQINIDWREETGEGALRGKTKVEFENICFIVDEMPVKGFFKGGQLIPVFPWKTGAEGFEGLADDYNDQYFNSCVWCEGKSYKMVNLWFFMNPSALTHHKFKPEHNPVDKAAEYDNRVRVITGNSYSLGCNDDNSKFKLRTRVAGRFAFGDTQWMGAGAYLAESSCGVMRDVCGTCDNPEPCANPVGGPEFEKCDGVTDCGEAECIKCGKVPSADGRNCVDEVDLAPCEITLEETAVDTAFTGEASELTLRINGACGRAGTVDYTLTDGSATADSEYTDVSGTATFEEGCTDDFLIVIPIIGSIDPESEFTVELSNPTGDLVLGECITTTVTILDATSDCDGGCSEPVAP